MDKLASSQLKFMRDKITHLQKEWESRKLRGERLLQKQESELRIDLERIMDQIKMFQTKADIIENIVTSGKEPEVRKFPP